MLRFVIVSEEINDKFIGKIIMGSSLYDKLANGKKILGGGLCKVTHQFFCAFYDKSKVNIPPFRFMFDELQIEDSLNKFPDGTCKGIYVSPNKEQELHPIGVDYPIIVNKKETPKLNNWDAFDDYL